MTIDRKFLIGEEACEVSVNHIDKHQIELTFEGRTFHFLKIKSNLLQVNNLETYEVKVQATGGKFQEVWVDNHRLSVCEAFGSDSSGGPVDPVVKSPMPGKITKVLCVKGDSIKKGQSIVVMEAMKMEYNVNAPIDGTVDELYINLNQQVDVGVNLIKISPIMDE